MTSQPARREQSRDQRDFLEIYTALERYDRLGLSSFVRTVSLFSCGICCNELPSAEAVSLPTSCHHGPVCRSCLANHLEGQIFAHRRGLNTRPEQVQAWREHINLRAIEHLPGFRWCSNAQCGSGHLLEDCDNCSVMTCYNCGAKTCARHRVAMHEGRTCEEYDADLRNLKDQTENSAKSVAFISKHYKSCPKCNHALEKEGGCDHFTCGTPLGCKAEFCHECLADYDLIRRSGNSAHSLSCKHHRE